MTLRKWLRLEVPENKLEALDRRAFLLGITATASGLFVPAPQIFLVGRPRAGVLSCAHWGEILKAYYPRPG